MSHLTSPSASDPNALRSAAGAVGFLHELLGDYVNSIQEIWRPNNGRSLGNRVGTTALETLATAPLATAGVIVGAAGALRDLSIEVISGASASAARQSLAQSAGQIERAEQVSRKLLALRQELTRQEDLTTTRLGQIVEEQQELSAQQGTSNEEHSRLNAEHLAQLKQEQQLLDREREELSAMRNHAESLLEQAEAELAQAAEEREEVARAHKQAQELFQRATQTLQQIASERKQLHAERVALQTRAEMLDAKEAKLAAVAKKLLAQKKEDSSGSKD